MGEPVKSRRYHSPQRSRRAEATRARVLAAAKELFAAQGYRATTTAALARAAGVSEASVFVAFGSKAALLVAVVGAAVAGSTADVPLRQHPLWQELAAETDRTRAVAGFVGFVRRAHQVTWRLLEMVRAAAEGDAELAEAATRAAQARHADCEWFLTSVLGLPASEPGTAAAADVLWAQSSVDGYRALVIDRGWSPERYEKWLTVVLCRELGIDSPGKPG